jgi:DNA-binding NarL/FixJ family response regulator
MSVSNTIKIIHADDHKLFRMGVKSTLSPCTDIEYLGEAENGKQLLDMLETLQPDIIILNIQMPVMHGLETLPVIKEKYPWIKVIMLSMHNDAKMVRKLIELGANAYLTKEAGSKDIIKAIYACKEKWFYLTQTALDAFNKTWAEQQ